ncbi:cyclohexanecarboxylate-CoA ligase [Mangrovimicrobium sediminis]|uniref:Cyclohexanecarboxylate-CoA ligase n=1 Tax=Mangrovimicrobium sediminis TaxID=2562682 RepID=A0A4Z0LYG4_9GAMM|nr:cyclohexanecarboxylate-CoA ligase [Haliea sp. SAOS-164]
MRWDEDRAQQAYESGLWVNETLADTLARIAREDPGRELLVEGEVRLDAQTLYAQAQAMARYLAARQAPGSVVSFMLPNWHEAAVIYVAATLAGMVAHPVLPSLREHDLRFMLADVDSRFIFIPAQFRGYDYVQMLGNVVGALDTPPEVVVLRGDAGPHTAYADLFADGQGAEPQPPEPDAVRMIMYTSGTTGSPKGVMHSHNSIHALIRQLGEHWRIDPGDSFLVASPISHIGGSIYAFEIPLLLGAKAVLMERWDPQEAVAHMRAEKVSHFAGATPFLVALLEAARAADTRLPDLKVFICGGASVPPSLVREAADYFERAVVTRVYGSTEVPVTTVGCTADGDIDHAAETDGRAGIASIRLSEAGEVLARGPQMLVGYVHADDEEKVFDAEGYYRTGDLGRWVDGDYLVIAGRIKDIIIRNGENIAPKEVEDLLLGHPGIGEVAIVGLPDPKTGERACAVIVPSGAAQPDVDSLREFLVGLGVAKFKIPEQVALRESLPKNDAGKVLKHRIRDELLAD